MTDEERLYWQEGYDARMRGSRIPDGNPYDDDLRAPMWNRGWHFADADIADRANARL